MNHKALLKAAMDDATTDTLVQGVPLFGGAIQQVRDYKRYGGTTAIDRQTWLGHHPLNIGVTTAAPLIGGAIAPSLMTQGMKKSLAPINRLLLGHGAHRMMPNFAARAIGALGVGLTAGNATRAYLSGEYTRQKLAAVNMTPWSERFQQAVGYKGDKENEAHSRMMSGFAAMAPMVAGQGYAMKAPLKRDILKGDTNLGDVWAGANNGVDYTRPNMVNAEWNAQRNLKQMMADNHVAYTAGGVDGDDARSLYDRGRRAKLERLNGLNVDPDASVEEYRAALRSRDQSVPLKLFRKGRTSILATKLNTSGPHYLPVDKGIGRVAKHTLLDPEQLKAKPQGIINMGGFPETSHIMAHELGHSMQPKWMMNPLARMGIKLGPALGTAAPIMSNDEQTSVLGAATGTAMAVPGLIGEYSASRRGMDLWKKSMGDQAWNGLSKMKRMGPFAGFPTYLAAASMPAAAFLGRKLSGGYDSKLDRMKDMFSKHF